MEDRKSFLYIVATPIGNLTDFSNRGISTLRHVDLIAVEDKRVSKRLLDNYEIKTKTISLHAFNEIFVSNKIINLLKSGKNIALICDSGTPTISDPGFPLIKLAIKNKIEIISIPGACAAISAMAISGIPTNRFSFEGFLSDKKNIRINRLKELSEDIRPVIIYESPKRIKKLLKELLNVFGKDRYISISRELTKIFESTYRGSICEIINMFELGEIKEIGEFVIVISGNDSKDDGLYTFNNSKLINMHSFLLDNGITEKSAIKIISNFTNIRKNFLYKLLIDVKKM